MELWGVYDKNAGKIKAVYDTIDGIRARWVGIRVPKKYQAKGKDFGWVFSGYLTDECETSSSAISPRNKYGADFSEVEAAAKKGNSMAQYKLGEYYKLGLGTKQDLKKAFEWYSKAAEQDEPMAFRVLGALNLLMARAKDPYDEKLLQKYEESVLHVIHFFCGIGWQDYWIDHQDIATYVAPDGYACYGLSPEDCIDIADNMKDLDGYHDNVISCAYYLEAARKGNREGQRKVSELFNHWAHWGRDLNEKMYLERAEKYEKRSKSGNQVSSKSVTAN